MRLTTEKTSLSWLTNRQKPIIVASAHQQNGIDNNEEERSDL